MEQDSIFFGRGPDPGDERLAPGRVRSQLPRLVVQLYGDAGSSTRPRTWCRRPSSGPPPPARFLQVDNPEAWLRTTAVNVHRSRWRSCATATCTRPHVPARNPGPSPTTWRSPIALHALPRAAAPR